MSAFVKAAQPVSVGSELVVAAHVGEGTIGVAARLASLEPCRIESLDPIACSAGSHLLVIAPQGELVCRTTLVVESISVSGRVQIVTGQLGEWLEADRRRHARVAVDFEARLRSVVDTPIGISIESNAGHLVDLSLSGAAMTFDTSSVIEPGTLTRFSIDFGSGRQAHGLALVARTSKDGIVPFHFVEFFDQGEAAIAAALGDLA